VLDYSTGEARKVNLHWIWERCGILCSETRNEKKRMRSAAAAFISAKRRVPVDNDRTWETVCYRSEQKINEQKEM
jgi:hypothetical protein